MRRNKINLSVITIILFLAVSLSGISKGNEKNKFEGIWAGALNIQGTKLDVFFEIKGSEDGGYTAKLNAPAQGLKNLPVNKVEAQNDSLTLEVEMIKGIFTGVFKDVSTIEGKWIQSGFEFPLILSKTDKLPELNRPQNPQKPYPYREEEVVFYNLSGNIKLAGTLTIPDTTKKYPAVLLISGSGAQDRDESLMGHKPFLVLSDYLTRNGIAVLRIDDRGVGGSTGNITESTSLDLAGDVLAGLKFLKNHKSVDTLNIGLIGHSEGGIIAPMVAAHIDVVAFIILLAAPGMTGEKLLYKQSELINKAAGATEEQIQLNIEMQKNVFNVLLFEKDSAKIVEDLQFIYSSGNFSVLTPAQKSKINDQINSINNIWFKFFLAYDPAPTLAKVKCPVLVLAGENDLQVSAKENTESIKNALTKGENTHFDVIEFKNLNHLFQHSETGSISEYGKIEETIAPQVLMSIKDWILKALR